MKKVLLFAVVVAGLGFTSCSKNDCECTLDGVSTVYTLDDANEGATEEIDQDQFESLCELGTDCKMV